MKKPDVLEKLKHHFQEEHGHRGEEGETSHEVSPISQTIDKLRSRIKASFSYFKIECGVTKVFSRSVVDPDPNWVRILELNGSRSVFQMRIQILTVEVRTNERCKIL